MFQCPCLLPPLPPLVPAPHLHPVHALLKVLKKVVDAILEPAAEPARGGVRARHRLPAGDHCVEDAVGMPHLGVGQLHGGVGVQRVLDLPAHGLRSPRHIMPRHVTLCHAGAFKGGGTGSREGAAG